MLKHLQKLIEQISLDSPPPILRPELEKVTAALMIQLAKVDQHIAPEELDIIHRYIEQAFQVPTEELNDIISDAKKQAEQATSLYEFTSLIHERFTASQKYEIVLNLWRVALADGQLDKYEEHFIRRAAELLYVPHPEFMRAKHEAAHSG